MDTLEQSLSRNERQKLGIQKWINRGCRGTLQWATGVGKTRAAIIAIRAFLTKNTDKKILVVVPTEHLKVQWNTQLVENQLFHSVDVQIINSAIKNKEKVDFLILDEAHRIPAESFIEVFKAKNPSTVLGLSATFQRLDGRHELLKRFCPVVDLITVKEAIKSKWLSEYVEYKVLIEPNDIDVYRQYNAEFYEYFGMFEFDFAIAMRCVTDIRYRRYYGKTLGINTKDMDAIAFTWLRALKARKKYVMDHPKKIELTRKILAARPNSKAITFSATIKQAETIGGGYVVNSGKTKKKNRLTIQEFSKLPYGVIHSAKGLDEGIDIPGLNLAIILSNTSSKNQKTQRIGRVIRYEPGKKAEIFTLVVKGTNEESWYNTSTDGHNYIEIDEKELDDILEGRETSAFEREAVESPLLFRF